MNVPRPKDAATVLPEEIPSGFLARLQNSPGFIRTGPKIDIRARCLLIREIVLPQECILEFLRTSTPAHQPMYGSRPGARQTPRNTPETWCVGLFLGVWRTL